MDSGSIKGPLVLSETIQHPVSIHLALKRLQYLVTFILGPGLDIHNQSIGVASRVNSSEALCALATCFDSHMDKIHPGWWIPRCRRCSVMCTARWCSSWLQTDGTHLLALISWPKGFVPVAFLPLKARSL